MARDVVYLNGPVFIPWKERLLDKEPDERLLALVAAGLMLLRRENKGEK